MGISRPVSDPVTPRELDARFGEADARTDAKLAPFAGEFNAINGKLDSIRNGQLAIAGLIIAALGIAVAVMAYGAQWFGLGLQSHDSLVAAAKEGAAQALKATGR